MMKNIFFIALIMFLCVNFQVISEETELGEKVPFGEDRAIEGLVGSELAKIKSKGFPSKRGQHPKHHGCVEATFTVLDNIPTKLKYGIFKEAKSFDALIRFSNGKEFDDTKPDAHGMAIKLMGVKGEKLLADEKLTQDFILVDSSVFFARDVQNLIAFMIALRKAQKGDPDALKPHQRSLKLLQQFLKKAAPNPLHMRYWSVTPYKLGQLPVAVKYMVKPAFENKSGSPQTPDSLRQEMAKFLQNEAASFDFYVQLKPTELPNSVVEDPSIQWNEETSVPIKVATITILPQQFTSPKQLEFCENLSFSPWHSLLEHKPLGGINRARNKVYIASSNLRHQINGVKPKEPKKGDMP